MPFASSSRRHRRLAPAVAVLVPSLPALALLGLLVAAVPAAFAVPVTVANPSFEFPTQADGVFVSAPSTASQGGYGWTFTPGFGVDSGVFNPPAAAYSAAGGNGTPTGAVGAQVGDIFNTGILEQGLAGNDSTFGTADDPLLTPLTTYTLTVGVGSPANTTSAGYALELYAGSTVQTLTLLGQTTGTAASLTTGAFVDRTLIVNSATLNPALYGQQLFIFLRGSSTSGSTDFDNVRFDAVAPEPSSAALTAIGAAVAGLLVRRRRLCSSTVP